MRLLLNIAMAASGFINKSYSKEELSNINICQFPTTETKVEQQPSVSIDVKVRSPDNAQTKSIPDIKEKQDENELHTLNCSKEKFR